MGSAPSPLLLGVADGSGDVPSVGDVVGRADSPSVGEPSGEGDPSDDGVLAGVGDPALDVELPAAACGALFRESALAVGDDEGGDGDLTSGGSEAFCGGVGSSEATGLNVTSRLPATNRIKSGPGDCLKKTWKSFASLRHA